MNLNVTVENYGKVVLTDKNYLAQGGEASVYVKDDLAFKLYHDPNKMIPLAKIEELKQIHPSNVLKPRSVIRKDNIPIGYIMTFQKNTHPICKLFTKAFRKKNNIDDNKIIELIKKIQETIELVHRANCLVVDMNEMNILASSRFKVPYFIDVDSYQTPSYKATAIMDSIRDRLVKNNEFTEESDWFSFAILAFQMYIGIHPYQGKHPKYKPNEWTKRMDDGISVFDRAVSIPRICNDLSVIPKSHLEWFKSIFIKNKRSIPPLPDFVSIISVSKPIQKVVGTEGFETKLVRQYDETIFSVFNFMGVNYAVGASKIYKEDKALSIAITDARKTEICESSNMSPIICELSDEGMLHCKNLTGSTVSLTKSEGFMYRNGAIYSVCNDKLIENTFVAMKDAAIAKTREACNVLGNATHIFDGVIFQDILGKCFIALPYEVGKCLVRPIPELDMYRILEARSERNVIGVLAEKNGKYDRFVIIFNETFTTYTSRVTQNIGYSAINLTVLPTGICVMACDTNVEIFKGNKVKVIANPPFDTSTRLFNYSGSVFFIDGNMVYSTKTK